MKMNALLVAILGCAACTPTLDTADGAGSSAAIIGGQTDRGDPAVVGLELGPGGGLCSSSLIAPTVLLTAAHCVQQDLQYTAVFGTTADSPTRIPVVATYYHEAFDGYDLAAGHDIAVAILAYPADVAPLPFNRVALPQSMVGESSRLVGYGVNTFSQRNAGTKRSLVVRINQVDTVRIGVGQPGHNACHGDSGGPAFAYLDGVETIIGVTSTGDDGQSCAFGQAYYTRVDDNLEFVLGFLEGPPAACDPTQANCG